MNLLAHVGLVGYDVKESVWEVLRMWRCKPKANVWSCLRDAMHELSETHAITLSQLVHFLEASTVLVLNLLLP